MSWKTYAYFTVVGILAIAAFVVFQPRQMTTEKVLEQMEPDKTEIIYLLDGMLEYASGVTQEK